MKVFVFLLCLSVTVCLSKSDSGACLNQVNRICSDSGNDWTVGSDCSADHGGFQANSPHIHKLMSDYFRDSFKMLFLSTKYSTDQKARMGFAKYFKGHSDKFWAKGKDMLKYITKRGDKVASPALGFQLKGLAMDDTHDEVSAFAATLDLLKSHASAATIVYRESVSSSLKSTLFDPAIGHYLEEQIEGFTDEIRDVSGHLNLLGRMAREETSKPMAIYFYNQMLQK